MNSTYPQVQQALTHHAAANVISTPAANKELVVFGNSLGEVEALNIRNDEKKNGDLKQGSDLFFSCDQWK